MTKIKGDIKAFIDEQLRDPKHPSYSQLARIISQRFGVQVSKASLSREAKALNLGSPAGRKRLVPKGERPSRSIFLDCAGGFFLKGAELGIGLLPAVNKMLITAIDSAEAQRTLKRAQALNAVLRYAPLFGLESPREIAAYEQRGLLYLAGLEGPKELPTESEINQYLQFLTEQKVLPIIIKEVTKACQQALYIEISFSGKTFYLDAQARTVWPSPKIPPRLSATINEARGYIENTFLKPSPERPLILQAGPGYADLPQEMLNFIHCLEGTGKEPIKYIALADKSGNNLKSWQNLKAPQKCFFIAPLSPWQYARLQGTKIIENFQQHQIGPDQEPMEVADAQINVYDTQLAKNIEVRAALIKRKEEQLALITNISRQEERYVRKLAEQYFCRWPSQKIPTYYDLLEEAHAEVLARSQNSSSITHVVATSYEEKPQAGFRLLLAYLHQVALTRFFPSEYAGQSWQAMQEAFYAHTGFLKIRHNFWEIILRPFPDKKLQNDAQIACQRFNQSGIRLSAQNYLRISLP